MTSTSKLDWHKKPTILYKNQKEKVSGSMKM